MRRLPSPIPRALACAVLLLCGSVPAAAGVHLWRVKEIFSNADGKVQFIEVATCCGSTGENFLANHPLTSNTNTFTFPDNVAGSTLNKHVLLATTGFAALPGAPAPDHIIADNFFSTGGDTITFSVYDTLTFPAGALPTDGSTSLNRNPNDPPTATFTAINSPTNYAGQTGSVNVVSGPPGVPDGRGGTTPLLVTPLVQDASSLRVSFDARSCTNAADHHILFGQRSDLPTAPGGAFRLMGSVCRIGTTTPYDWVGVPQATDGSNLLWMLVVATDSSVIEGSWGRDGRGVERVGSGANGSSGVCALDRSLANACGHP